MSIKNLPIIKIFSHEYQIKEEQGRRLIKIFASEKIFDSLEKEVFNQAVNVASLPGLAGPICLMPDSHVGYGAPIGTVFAMKEDRGYISPGAIGYDINCGMRLIITNLTYKEIKPFIKKIVDRLFEEIPTGLAKKGFLKVNKKELKNLVEKGVHYLVNNINIGWEEDIKNIEEEGQIKGADFQSVSQQAIERGLSQLVTLGSGNHYLEIQRVEKIFDKKLAEKYKICQEGQIGIMIHCGSRGFGHQVCSDYLKIFKKHASKFKINLKDWQLICAPINSSIAKNYIKAMSSAANFAFVNREVISHKVREIFARVLGGSPEKYLMKLICDVAHNIGKWEIHQIPETNRKEKVFVHRKGATRSFPNQPIIIGGSMETGSYLLEGHKESLEKSYGSTAHGSGRTMSREKAKKVIKAEKLWNEMLKKEIYVRSLSFSGLAEEAGVAYKDINEVIETVEKNNLSTPVAYFRPLGNIKG